MLTVPIPSVLLQANDCENGTTRLYDQDGDGVKLCADDCDDNDPNISPFQWKSVTKSTTIAMISLMKILAAMTTMAMVLLRMMVTVTITIRMYILIKAGFTNGIDDNCDGMMDPSESDQDGDGMSTSAGDCNDNGYHIHGTS